MHKLNTCDIIKFLLSQINYVADKIKCLLDKSD